MKFSLDYNCLKNILKESGKDYYNNVKELYEKNYKNKPLEVLSYSKFKDVYRTGDRLGFENQKYDYNVRLGALQVLSLCDDSYIEDLEDVLSAYCDQYTWTYPAHILKGKDLFDYKIVDLASSMVAMALAQTVYVFDKKLTNDIKLRVKEAIFNKVINNYEKQNFWWDCSHTNWSSVCAGSIGIAYLCLFPERFPDVEKRILNSLNCFIDGFGDDGYCFEGVDYWDYGVSFLYYFLAQYDKVPKDSIFFSEKMFNILRYPQSVNFGKTALMFADGGNDRKMALSLSHSFSIKSVYGDLLNKKNIHLPVDINKSANRNVPVSFYEICGLKDLTLEKETVDIKDYFYEKSEIYISKKKNYIFSTKCGNVCEMVHNHEDAGAFAIVVDGVQQIADLGAGEYTREYFDYDYRYGEKVFVCSGFAHAIPIIDGKTQEYKEGFKGKVIKAEKDYFEFEISGAYKDKIDSLIVSYTLSEKSVKVNYKMTDKNAHDITLRLISILKPTLGENVEIDKITIKSRLKAKLSSKDYSGSKAVPKKAYLIDYELKNVKTINEEFIINIK